MGHSHFTPAKTSANAPFFHFQQGEDPLKPHAGGVFRAEEALTISLSLQSIQTDHTDLFFVRSSSSHDSSCSPTLDYLTDVCSPWLLGSVSINLTGGFKGQRFTEAQLIKFLMLPERTSCIPCLWNL